ncbi:SDR family oxidoreductase [Candidatus Pacearchaeota archaeon]|nr:SDR family oxidoreductase [Candidatus Pacearchaeota archaeon]
MEKMVAIVTGATGSIGKDIATFLLNKNIEIIGTYNKNEKEARKLEKENTGLKMFHLDLSSKYSIDRFTENISIIYPKINFLINNAGIKKDSLLENMPEEDITNVINTNLIGTIILTKKIIPKIKESKGRIINISSLAGEIGNFGQTNYSASKAGLIAFSKSLSKELAKFNVTVNAIAPGLIESKMVDSIPNEIKEKIINKISLKRVGSPRAVSELVYFMLTNEENYINGETIRVNGGLLS